MNEMAQLLRTIRESKRMSQNDLAEKLNITQPAYARIESGETALKYETLHQFAAAVDMSIVEVITYPEKLKRKLTPTIYEDHKENGVDQVRQLQNEIKRLNSYLLEKNEEIKFLRSLLSRKEC